MDFSLVYLETLPLSQIQSLLKTFDTENNLVREHLLTLSLEVRKKIAADRGNIIYMIWKKMRTIDGTFARIYDLCHPDGTPKEISATFNNDDYKLKMAALIAKLQSYYSDQIITTFGLQFRDANFKTELKKSDNKLISSICTALKTLESRKFNPDVFKKRYGILPNQIVDDSVINYICFQDGNLRTLVDTDGVKEFNSRYERTPEDNARGRIIINFYYDDKLDEFFLEVSGPWLRCTFLETALMQAVYSAKLNYDLDKKYAKSQDGIPNFMKWIDEAMLRCAKSVEFTKLIQIMYPSFRTALFTGRRTGHYLFLLLQNLYFGDNFSQFIKMDTSDPQNPIPVCTVPSNSLMLGNTSSLGTSSFDSWYTLSNMSLPCLTPTGTIAHEMMMGASCLFSRMDNNPINLPLSQVIVHHMFEILVQNKIGGPLPGLSDTLGTPSFFAACKFLHVTPGVEFLSHITSARQDSGTLEEYISNAQKYGYTGAIMASEIEGCESMDTAAKLGYKSAGAGGFYGDRRSVWDPSNEFESSNNMAVKIVKIEFDGHVDYPVKLSDIEGKLSIKMDLPPDQISALVYRAMRLRNDFTWTPETPSITIDQIFNINSAHGILDRLPWE